MAILGPIPSRPVDTRVGSFTREAQQWFAAIRSRLNPGRVAAAAVDGFALLPTVIGTPTGIPVVPRDSAPVVFDPNTGTLWIHNGVGWVSVVLS